MPTRATSPLEPDPSLPTDPPTEPDDPTATTAPPASRHRAAVVADIEEFVAAERGLPFLREVTVELADDAEFEARLLEDFEEDAADIETSGQVLQALGLVAPGTDIVDGPPGAARRRRRRVLRPRDRRAGRAGHARPRRTCAPSSPTS